MTPDEERELSRLHLTNRSKAIMPIYTIGGGTVGAILVSLVWVSQLLSPTGPRAELWVFAGFGAGVGAFIGYALGQERPRACPVCANSMGKPQ